MKKIFNKEFAIGASVIVAIAILIFGIDFLKGINLFKPANFYVAPFSNVGGLEVAAPVSIDGFKVGQVRDIRFNYDSPGEIEVELALDKQLRLPEGTTAVLTPSLLGGPSIELKLGSGNRMIEVGGKVATAHSADLMSSLSGDLMPQVSSVIPKIDSLLYNLNLLVADPALQASIRRLDGISGNLLATTSGLNSTLNSQFPLMMRNAAHITTTLDSTAMNLADLSYRLHNLPLESTLNNVNEITANLTRFSNQLNDTRSSLGLLMSDPELYQNLTRVTADVDSLIVDIKRNPKRYISIKLL